VDDNADISWSLGSIRENMKTSVKGSVGHDGLKQHKLWFGKECLQLLCKRKQSELKWLENQSQMAGSSQ
jgi:hypothetical protein